MNVSIKTIGTLGRRLECMVPASEVQTRFAKRLSKLSKRVRLDGFRPGKVPLSVIRERYGTQAFREIVSEMIEDTYHKTIKEHELQPTGQPKIDDIKAQPDVDLEFSATIEVFPNFDPQILEGVRIEKLTAELKDSDVDDMIMQLRRSQAEWKVVERPVGKGDRVKVKFIDEKYAAAFGAQDNELTVIAGVSRIMGDFDEQLIGGELGKKVKVKVRFPEDCAEKKLVGKTKRFKVVIEQIEECLLPDVDQAFLEKYDIHDGGVEQLKKTLREGMEHQLKKKLESHLKEKIISALIEKNNIEIPQTLVKGEIDRLKKEMINQFNLDENAAENLKDELFLERAKRQVKFSLIVNKIIEQQKLQVSSEELEKKIEELASAYEQPEQVKQYYRNNPDMDFSVRMMVLQDQVIQRALESAEINEIPSCFEDVMRSSEQ